MSRIQGIQNLPRNLGASTMPVKSNLQDTFLNHIRRNRIPVTVFLVNGVKLQGIVTWFDSFCVLLRRDRLSQLAYKHAISTIMPSQPISLHADAESEDADAESEDADAESEDADVESEDADAESEDADAESEDADAESEDQDPTSDNESEDLEIEESVQPSVG